MAANPAHLTPVPDDDDRHLADIGDPAATDVRAFLGLLRDMQQDRTVKRSRHARRTEEILANKSLLVVETYAVGQTSRGLVGERGRRAIKRSARLWDALIQELGSALSDDQRNLLELAKDEDLAAEYEDKQYALKLIQTVLRAALLTSLSRPDDEFRELSLWESFADGFTNNRSKLKRRGLPALSEWEELTDDLDFTDHANKRLRDDERARQRAFLALLSGVGASDGEDD